MRYLLDTHILFWSMADEDKLPEDVLAVINDRDNDIFFSSASVWEVVIKHAKAEFHIQLMSKHRVQRFF